MKIRSKLSLLFTFLAAAILAAFAASVYFSAYKSRESEFYASLRKEAVTKANLYFTAKVDPVILQAIYKNNRETISEVEVAIYDTGFNLLYHDAVDIDFVKETREMIDQVRQNKDVKFYKDRWQVTGILFPHEGKEYIVIATAFDQYGYKKLESLRNTIFGVFFGAVLFIYLIGKFFSGRALSPVTGIVRKARSITASNMDLRLGEGNGKDEIGELARTFNEMLDRLESSFDAQKHFVSNISHELRTPIAALITELELAAEKSRTPQDYQRVIADALGDARKLAKLTGSLLDFAKAHYDPSEIAFKELRLDEVLLDARLELARQFPDFNINIRYEQESADEDDMSVYGNEYLLKVAFANLLENGCKFSADKSCQVLISTYPGHVMLNFADHGIGIPAEDLPHVFTPFYRGGNKGFAGGNGIGLALSKRIIELHQGKLSVGSSTPSGSTFMVTLDHAKRF